MSVNEHTRHAPLAPSAAARWMDCPASVPMSEGISDTEGPYAREGTLAHELAAIRLYDPTGENEDEGKRWRKEALKDLTYNQVDDIVKHINSYTDFVMDRLGQFKGATLLIEQKVNPGIPECWGTADAVIWSKKHIEIIDFKYGAGVHVDVDNNPQLKIYALGAMNLVKDITGTVPERVIVTIYQPRYGGVSSVDYTASNLKRWRKKIVIPAAEKALSNTLEFSPGVETCRWCPAAGECKPRAEKFAALDFAKAVNTLEGDDYAELLERLDGLEAWAKDIRAAAKNRLWDGEDIPGWRLAQNYGKRVITDADKALKLLAKNDIDGAAPRTLLPLTKLEAAAGGKATLNKILKPVLEHKEGSIAVVRDGDSRPAIDPETSAREDFR